jgi:hypothetical protein
MQDECDHSLFFNQQLPDAGLYQEETRKEFCWGGEGANEIGAPPQFDP